MCLVHANCTTHEPTFTGFGEYGAGSAPVYRRMIHMLPPDWPINLNERGIIWYFRGLQNSNIVCFCSKIGRNVMGEFTISKREHQNNKKIHKHTTKPKKRKRTHSPYSQIDSLAIFQHKSISSLVFPNLRPLFAPRVAFFSSFDICFLCGPVLRWYSSWPRDLREAFVDPSAASSSGRFCVVYEIRYLKAQKNGHQNDMPWTWTK